MAKLKASFDDGCSSDVRVADLMQKYEIPTVFYWPVEWRSLAYEKGYEPLTILEAVSIASRFEIGSHTITHRHLTRINPVEAKLEISDSKFMLEALFAKDVKKFCPPRGYTSDELTDYTLKFYDSQRLTKGKGLVHIHPDSGANNNLHWRTYYELIRDQNDVVELWGHSHELDRFNLWDELELFIREQTR